MSTIYRAASVATLQQIKDVTEEDARKIRALWKAENFEHLEQVDPQLFADTLGSTYFRPVFRAAKRELINAALNTFGVEYLGTMRRSCHGVWYCNAGDTYAATIIFVGKSLTVGCWGDLVETGKVKECNNEF